MKKIIICSLLAALVCLTAGWAPSLAGAAAPGQSPPVRMRSVAIAGGVPVANGAPVGARARGTAGGQTALRQTAAPTLDAGMRFTMAGVICGVPSTSGAVILRLRTSLDGRSWSPWREAPLELAGEAGGPPRAFTEPVWTGAARYIRVAAVAGGAASPALLEHERHKAHVLEKGR